MTDPARIVATISLVTMIGRLTSGDENGTDDDVGELDVAGDVLAVRGARHDAAAVERPPAVPSFSMSESMTITWAPLPTAASAAARPTVPAPRIRTVAGGIPALDAEEDPASAALALQ